jgi:putative DNA primase/helicase
LNGVYDLQKNIFRDYNYNDYITTNTGYNYKKSTVEDRQFIDNLITKIESDDKKRYLLYQILATGIIGKSYQKFILFNGSGGNGKSLLSNLMRTALGKYCVELDVNILCSEKKSGPSPEYAILNKARYAIASEPNENEKIKNGNLKSLTGNKKITGRLLFSNNTDITLMATVILECNKKIKLSSEATDGEIRRIVDFLFESKFVENDNDVDEANKVYKADKDLLNDEFLDKYKYAFIDILIEKAYNFLYIDKEQFFIPKSVSDRTNEYISSSYTYLEYIKELTIFTENKTDFIQMKNLFDIIKSSDIYINSTKEEKRKITLKSICDFFQNNKNTARYYKERFSYYDNGKKHDINKVLLYHKFLENYND